jgi:hypothetical protein
VTHHPQAIVVAEQAINIAKQAKETARCHGYAFILKSVPFGHYFNKMPR